MSNQIFNFQTDVCEITDKGRVRPKNEDAKGYAETVNGHVFVVCDGMGGHVGGQVASNIAVESIVTYFSSEKKADIYDAISSSIKYANLQIYNKAKEDTSLRGMGTTVVLLIVQDDKIYIGHVGDSRIYIHSDKKLHRISKDHSFVQGLVDSGAITDDEAETHPRKNELMRALGIRAEVKPEVAPKPIKAKNGDTFLLCSDGLNGMVNDLTMEATLNKSIKIKEKGNELLNFALNAGGTDNITLQLLQVSSSDYPRSVFISKSPVQREIPKTDPDIKMDKATRTLTGTNSYGTRNQNTQRDNYEKNDEYEDKDEENRKKKLIYIIGGALAVAIVLLGLFLLITPDDKPYKAIYISGENTQEIDFYTNKEDAIVAANKYLIDKKLTQEGWIIIKKEGEKIDEVNLIKEEEEVDKYKVIIIGKNEQYKSWWAIYKEFEVCPCYIIKANGKNDFTTSKDGWFHPKLDRKITIPLEYSGLEKYNPNNFNKYAKGGVNDNLTDEGKCREAGCKDEVKPENNIKKKKRKKENNLTTDQETETDISDNEITEKESDVPETVVEEEKKKNPTKTEAQIRAEYKAELKAAQDKYDKAVEKYDKAKVTTGKKKTAYSTITKKNNPLIIKEKKKSDKKRNDKKIANLREQMQDAYDALQTAKTAEATAKAEMKAAEKALDKLKN